jgi:peroxiredoxin Q/BCP
MRSILVLLSLMIAVGTAHAGDVIQPGSRFPTWELTDHTGAKMSSRALAGKTYLLWFYPKAMTPGCTAEGDALRDQFAAFQARGVEILGVSFDTPEDNASFVRQQGFPFRLLSDTDRTLAAAAGAASDPRQPVARRISYLVGPDGKVVKVYPQVTPGTHAQDVLSDLIATGSASTPTKP